MEYFEPHFSRYHSKLNVFFTRNWLRIRYYWNKIVLRRRIIPLEGCISMSWGHVEHNNWGDDINFSFLEHISNDCILPASYIIYPYNGSCKEIRKMSHYSAIGSVLGWIDSDDVKVWGSGLIDGDAPKCIPQIYAIRGPLSREISLKNGINCPPVYGDPALLLPYYYRPKMLKKKYSLGIVTHYVDYYKKEMDKFKENPNVQVIKLFGYKEWTDIIDQICSCELILSSSLHGLIVAEAYKVPNVWCEVREPIKGKNKNRFKFYDFFSSIGKNDVSPVLINMSTSIEDTLKLIDIYRPGIYDTSELLKVCPWSLKNPKYPNI